MVKKIVKNNKTKTGHAVSLRFSLTQHKRDKELLELIGKSLNCGAVYSQTENVVTFEVFKFSQIYEIIIPFLESNPIQGTKHLDFLDFCQAAQLIKEGLHLTPKGLAKILLIKNRMNTKRK